MLWVDKYRPTKLEDLSYHDAITERLTALSNTSSNATTNTANTLPHLFFYGPSGSGKKTRIAALLRNLYGPGADKLRLDKRTFTTPTKKTIDLNMITSNYHIELSPGDAGINDRFVVQDVIKEMAANKNIAASTAASSDSKAASMQRPSYKIVVLNEVDKLSKQAQAALRRTMEKYSSTCRLVLCSTSQSKVIEPVRSRCLGIRIPAPSIDEICSVLQTTGRKQSITIPEEVVVTIARESSRNVRRAILMLEAWHVQHRDSTNTAVVVQKPDWELYIHQLATDITKEQSPARLLLAREKLYELLVHCIPSTLILRSLVTELCKNLDDDLQSQVYYWAAFYEHRMSMNSSNNKEIFHLEAFLAKYMAIYKQYLNDLFG